MSVGFDRPLYVLPFEIGRRYRKWVDIFEKARPRTPPTAWAIPFPS